MKNRKLVALFAAPALAAASIGNALAVPPTYITDALTTAQTTLTDYITAAAPMVFNVTVILCALFLVLKLLKKAAH